MGPKGWLIGGLYGTRTFFNLVDMDLDLGLNDEPNTHDQRI